MPSSGPTPTSSPPTTTRTLSGRQCCSTIMGAFVSRVQSGLEHFECCLFSFKLLLSFACLVVVPSVAVYCYFFLSALLSFVCLFVCFCH